MPQICHAVTSWVTKNISAMRLRQGVYPIVPGPFPAHSLNRETARHRVISRIAPPTSHDPATHPHHHRQETPS
jgi:hypothetical protein